MLFFIFFAVIFYWIDLQFNVGGGGEYYQVSLEESDTP